MYARDVDPVIRAYDQYIDSWGYVAGHLWKASGWWKTTEAATTTDPKSPEYAFIYGISPSELLDSSIFNAYTNETTSLGVTE